MEVKFSMRHSDFVPLHLHTEYSLLDGAIKIDELIEQASIYRLPAIAITDHGNLHGAVKFYKKATKAGIKPIIGCEVYVAPNSRHDRVKTGIDVGLTDEAAFHLVLLARNTDGYKNLTTLVTKAYLEGFYYKPRIDKDLLEQYSGGLIGLSACLKGEVPYCLKHGNIDRARESALGYKNILGPENFYLEIQDNKLPEQDEVNKQLIDLSQELHIPLVATQDCHYLKREDAKAHDMLLCIQTGKLVKDKKRMRMGSDEFYFKSPDEMKQSFHDIPEAIANTRLIADRCNLDLAIGRNLLPRYEVPNGASAASYLEELVFDGLKVRLRGNSPANYLDRLKQELRAIKKMGYSSYFLIVWDFIRYAKKNGIPVGPGRGSVAGSLAAYCLGITEIDSIKYGLLFERFLNPERISMPDIDVDFCRDRRHEVISYVSEKYGKDHVAQVITFGTMAAKAAIRDVGRVLSIPYAKVDRIAKLIPMGNNASIESSLKVEPQLRELYDNNSEVKELLDIAKRLEGLSRHASTHAAGVVIAPEMLTDFMPLYKNPSDPTITTQFDMGSVEDMGLLKFDFLGLKTLTILEKTMSYIKRQGIEINLAEIPLDDEHVYRLLSSGKTIGIFQLESSGMRDILIRMQPNRFEDLIALVALYRPGPLGSGMIEDFIRRKKGEIEVKYELPQLKEILDETYGVILYQEQVMKIANKIANFSLGQADILRKAMGKKLIEEMGDQKDVFISGAIANGIPERKAARLFELVALFAEYGFNKSHSAAYAYLAYQTAYLKMHYPVEFMTANLSADIGDTDKVVKIINECRSMSIEILSPDINESEREFKIVGSSIRFGLEAIKGVGSSAIESILAARQNSRFSSFEEFLSRVNKANNKKVNKRVIEGLIKAGAFDCLYLVSNEQSAASSKTAHGSQLTAHSRCHARAKAMNTLVSPPKTNIPSLFGDNNITADDVHEWDETILLNLEKESLGFYISGHPMSGYRVALSAKDAISISALEDIEGETDIYIAGIISEIKSRAKEKGITAYLVLEDETGICEVLVFPEVHRKTTDLLKKGNLIMIRGGLLNTEKGSKVIARDIQTLDDTEINTKYEINLRCDDFEDTKERLMNVRRLMKTASNDNNSSVTLKLYFPEYCVIIASRLQPTSNFIAGVKGIAGVAVREN